MYCERTEEFLSSIEQFIKTVIGNRYNISIAKLLLQRKTLN